MERDGADDSELIFEDDDRVPVRRGYPILACLVILTMVTLIATRQKGARPEKQPLGKPTSSPQDVIMLLQCRYLVGASNLMREMPIQQANNNQQEFYRAAAELNRGTIEQRLRFVIVASELIDADEALKLLNELAAQLEDSEVEVTNEQARLMDIVERLMADYSAEDLAAPSVNEEDRSFLAKKLGWFGALALAPRDSEDVVAREQVMSVAQRTMVTMLGALGTVGLFGLGGTLGLIVLGIYIAKGQVSSSLRCDANLHGGIYAETFAVWLITFLLCSFLASEIPTEGNRTLLVAGGMFLSLISLVWPWVRGISWSTIREDIGWTLGKKPLLEPFVGVAAYAMTLPILAVGLLLTVVLMYVSGLAGGPVGPGNEFTSPDMPSHPIVEVISGAGDWMRLQLFLVAAVAAPVVEETMFRGVLYRFLREASARFGFLLSFLFALTFNSFIFAVVHPQGYLAVPVLMAIAFGLTIAREWRGSLIPSMIAHGIHNGLVMLVLILAIGT